PSLVAWRRRAERRASSSSPRTWQMFRKENGHPWASEAIQAFTSAVNGRRSTTRPCRRAGFLSRGKSAFSRTASINRFSGCHKPRTCPNSWTGSTVSGTVPEPHPSTSLPSPQSVLSIRHPPTFRASVHRPARGPGPENAPHLCAQRVQPLLHLRRLRELVGREHRARLERRLHPFLHQLLLQLPGMLDGGGEITRSHHARGKELRRELVMGGVELIEDGLQLCPVALHDLLDLALLFRGQVERPHHRGEQHAATHPAPSAAPAARSGAGFSRTHAKVRPITITAAAATHRTRPHPVCVATSARGGASLRTVPRRLRSWVRRRLRVSHSSQLARCARSPSAPSPSKRAQSLRSERQPFMALLAARAAAGARPGRGGAWRSPCS